MVYKNLGSSATNQLTCALLHANKTIWILDKKYASSNVKLLAVVLSFCGFYCLIILLLKNQNCKKWHIIFTLKTPQTTIFEKTKFSCHLFQKMCRPLLDFYWEESTEVRDLSNFQQCFLILFTLNSLITSRTKTLIPETIIL